MNTKTLFKVSLSPPSPESWEHEPGELGSLCQVQAATQKKSPGSGA